VGPAKRPVVSSDDVRPRHRIVSAAMRMTPWPKPGSRPSRASSATDGRFPGYEHVEHETLHWIGILRMKVIHEEAGLRQGHGLRKVGRFAAGGGWGCGGNAPVIHLAALGGPECVRGSGAQSSARPSLGGEARLLMRARPSSAKRCPRRGARSSGRRALMAPS
jgi:hypothetical protein